MQNKLKPINQHPLAPLLHIVPGQEEPSLPLLLQNEYKCNAQFAFSYIFSLETLSGEAQDLYFKLCTLILLNDMF